MQVSSSNHSCELLTTEFPPCVCILHMLINCFSIVNLSFVSLIPRALAGERFFFSPLPTKLTLNIKEQDTSVYYSGSKLFPFSSFFILRT